MTHRLRHAARAAGVVLVSVFAAAWVGSRWFTVGWKGHTGPTAAGRATRVELSSGVVRLEHRPHPRAGSLGGLVTVEPPWEDWTPRFYAQRIYIPVGIRLPLRCEWSAGEWFVQMPLWIPTLVCAVPVAWSIGRVWCRRRRGQCPRCGYDLRGLSAVAACPECGDARQSSTAISTARGGTA